MNYDIAGYPVALPQELIGRTHFARALAPFAAETEADPVLRLIPDAGIALADYDFREADCFDFPDADADCHFGRYDGGYLFYMQSRRDDSQSLFIKADGSPEVRTNLVLRNDTASAMLRFGLWMMFGIAVNPLHAVAVHSSVIRVGDGAVMFLGESGTGKSTHTRLWRENIPGAELLNDDSPIVRIVEGVPTVCGSPWSGKTPCYKNERYPIRAIVRLSQAPHNRIRRLPVIAAIGALLPSCPPAFAYDATLQDNICGMLSEILSRVPAYHLECLPDADAARLSFETVFRTNE